MLALRPNAAWAVVRKPLRQWQKIIVHHTPLPDDYPTKIELADINRMYTSDIKIFHIEHRGFHDIGYHFTIEGSGAVIASMRWLYQIIGAHCYGHNEDSIGIAVIGNFSIENSEPNKFQLTSLEELINVLALPAHPHSKYGKTECPGKYFPVNLFSKE